MLRLPVITACAVLCALVCSAFGPASPSRVAAAATAGDTDFATPIEHVVVIDQENHSFDNVLGRLCVVDARCDGATVGLTTSGSVPLSTATDFVPKVAHSAHQQMVALDKGKMDGWNRLSGCKSNQCLTQYDPEQIPSLAALARSGVIADRYFSDTSAQSFGSHLLFTNQTLDGMSGDNPQYVDTSVPRGPGWGCDSNLEVLWQGQWEPSCIPFPDGTGAFKATPVPHTDTVMDRLDAAGRSWKIYSSPKPVPRRNGQPRFLDGYEWNPCTYNADCIYTSQANNLAADTQVLSDASAGTLPAFSLVVPNGPNGQTSQHNATSMILGDNWIGSIVQAIQAGPDAGSTTIFITWDDCGCFYDHVPPPNGYGIRLPLVIVSPYAKPGFTDSTIATSASILAYMEHVLGIAPVLATADGSAYDFADSFDYEQPPALKTFRFTPGVESAATKAEITANPADPDDDT